MRYILIICLLGCENLVAQQTAMFETTLFFEDGQGNRDTLIVGFDSLANYSFNPAFGEINLTQPFDSVFEVRATHGGSFFGNPQPMLSKKIIGGSEKVLGIDDCYIGELVVMFPKIKYQPLKIRWNKIDFQGSDCLANSYLTPDQIPLVLDPPWAIWEWDLRFGCLSVEDSLIIYLDQEHQNLNEIPFTYIQQSNGQVDTIFGVALMFEFFPSFSPCNWIVPTEEINTPASTSTTLVYPTLTLGEVKLENTGNDPIKQIEVLDVAGRVLSILNTNLYTGQNIDLNLTNFSSGLFFILDRTATGKTNTHRVIKIQ